jgi:hypothetical protein
MFVGVSSIGDKFLLIPIRPHRPSCRKDQLHRELVLHRQPWYLCHCTFGSLVETYVPHAIIKPERNFLPIAVILAGKQEPECGYSKYHKPEFPAFY